MDTFKQGDIVKVKDSSSHMIDGKIGKIVGLSVNEIVSIWIVDFGGILDPIDYPFSAGTFPGSLLERI